MRTLVLASVIGFTIGLGRLAAASPTEARQLYQEANAHFAVGEYLEAAEGYQKAYKMKPDPALLYNAAQAYRLGGNHQKALTLYRSYVQFYPNEKNVTEVRQQIVALKDVLAASSRAQNAPPSNTVESPVGDPAAPGVVSPPPAATPTSGSSAPEPSQTADVPKRRLKWTWVGVGVTGGLALLSAGLGGFALSDYNHLKNGCGLTGSCSSSEINRVNGAAHATDALLTLTAVAAVGTVVAAILETRRRPAQRVAFLPNGVMF